MSHRFRLWWTVLACCGAFVAGACWHPVLPDAWASAPPGFGEVTVGNFTAIGPMLWLRHYLTEQQSASLTSDDAHAPLLARAEILSARSRLSPPDFSGDLSADLRRMRTGFVLRTRLYWLTPETDGTLPRGSVRIARMNGPGDTLLWREEGPRMMQLRVETVDFTVEPTTVIPAAPVASPPGMTALPALIEGGTGWTLTHRQLIDTRYPTSPYQLSLYDPS